MPDIRLQIAKDKKEFDVAVQNADLVTGNDLATAIYISLFTWARAKNDDDIPSDTLKFGWWGDKIAEDNNHNTGSRLWLLLRKKMTQETINEAVSYIEEALEWMVKDGVVSKINIAPEIKGNDELDILITLYRNTELLIDMRFNNLWKIIAGEDGGKFN